ncbi:MAG: OmpA family protein, partial [Pseudomonadota bacterium]
FHPIRSKPELIAVGEPVRDTSLVPDIPPPTASSPEVPPAVINPSQTGQEELGSDRQRFGTLAAALQTVLIPYIEKGLVEVSYNQNRLEIDMKSKLMFESGSVRISQDAFNALRNISEILKTLPNVIHVEGHTDNRPISNLAYPSNWELSSARAASVVNLMVRAGVEPTHIAALGYAQFQPIADNQEEDGRQKNRRVTLVVLGQGANPLSQPVRKPQG